MQRSKSESGRAGRQDGRTSAFLLLERTSPMKPPFFFFSSFGDVAPLLLLMATLGILERSVVAEIVAARSGGGAA
jgi:hypothetical protein